MLEVNKTPERDARGKQDSLREMLEVNKTT